MNEYEVFARAYRCTIPMAESIVKRIRERVGREVPMSEILAAIKKIPPTRLTTDTLVLRLQKNSGKVPNRSPRAVDEEDFDIEPEIVAMPHPARATTPKRPSGAQGQIATLLEKNWTQARSAGLNPPNMSVEQFVRLTQSTVGEPKPTVARVLTAVQKLSKQDVLITPNLTADEIIETDELR